jgi:hypothetical protein
MESSCVHTDRIHLPSNHIYGFNLTCTPGKMMCSQPINKAHSAPVLFIFLLLPNRFFMESSCVRTDRIHLPSNHIFLPFNSTCTPGKMICSQPMNKAHSAKYDQNSSSLPPKSSANYVTDIVGILFCSLSAWYWCSFVSLLLKP